MTRVFCLGVGGLPSKFVILTGGVGLATDLESIRDELDAVFGKIARSADTWARRKAELEAGRRWIELVY